jgi:hypothetical protein
MRLRLFRLALCCSFALPIVATAGTIVLDGFTDAFPPNPCLPNSGARVIFSGVFCDGAN